MKNQLSCLFRAADAAGLIPATFATMQPWPDRSQRTVMKDASQTSPYRHRFKLPPYRRKLDTWPDDIQEHWTRYRADRQHEVRTITLDNLETHLEAYVGYGLGIDVPPAAGWNDLFDVQRLKRFSAWHARRVGVDRISAYAHNVVGLIARLAKHEARPEAEALHQLEQQYQRPPKMHDKHHPLHSFTRTEIDQIACSLIADGRRPLVKQPSSRKHPGLRRAILFQTGLILRIMLRLGVRQRCIREMQIGRNLYRVNGGWVVHFTGEQLKVATRKGKQNVYHVDFPEDLMPELTEFLQDVRPRFPHADQQPYVFLTQKGRPHTRDSLYGQITEKVYLYSGGKRLYPHLMRTLFFSEGVHANKDINFLASALNIDPVTALRHYNEIRAEDVMKTLADFNRETLRPSPR